MKRVHVISITFLAGLIVGCAVPAAHAESSQYTAAQVAKAQIGESLYKFGLLTNSFTEQGHANEKGQKKDLAEMFSQKIDKVISDGLGKDELCDDISSDVNKLMNRMFKESQGDITQLSKPARRAAQSAIDSSTAYAQSQCNYLSE